MTRAYHSVGVEYSSVERLCGIAAMHIARWSWSLFCVAANSFSSVASHVTTDCQQPTTTGHDGTLWHLLMISALRRPGICSGSDRRLAILWELYYFCHITDNKKLVHWPSISGLLHLVQWRVDWPWYTLPKSFFSLYQSLYLSTASVPNVILLCNGPLLEKLVTQG